MNLAVEKQATLHTLHSPLLPLWPTAESGDGGNHSCISHTHTHTFADDDGDGDGDGDRYFFVRPVRRSPVQWTANGGCRLCVCVCAGTSAGTDPGRPLATPVRRHAQRSKGK